MSHAGPEKKLTWNGVFLGRELAPWTSPATLPSAPPPPGGTAPNSTGASGAGGGGVATAVTETSSSAMPHWPLVLVEWNLSVVDDPVAVTVA